MSLSVGVSHKRWRSLSEEMNKSWERGWIFLFQCQSVSNYTLKTKQFTQRLFNQITSCFLNFVHIVTRVIPLSLYVRNLNNSIYFSTLPLIQDRSRRVSDEYVSFSCFENKNKGGIFWQKSLNSILQWEFTALIRWSREAASTTIPWSRTLFIVVFWPVPLGIAKDVDVRVTQLEVTLFIILSKRITKQMHCFAYKAYYLCWHSKTMATR